MPATGSNMSSKEERVLCYAIICVIHRNWIYDVGLQLAVFDSKMNDVETQWDVRQYSINARTVRTPGLSGT